MAGNHTSPSTSPNTAPTGAIAGLSQVTVRAPGGTPLLNNVSFTLDAGTHTALIGRSGSGKSLIASLLTNRRSPLLTVQGEITTPKRSSLIHQDSSDAFNPLVRLGTQLALAESDQQVVVDTLERLGLPHAHQLLTRYPAELSGGQRQRVAIAMSLLTGAQLIVADESTTALDPINQHAVVEAFRAIEDPALLFITHDIALAAQCCQRIIVVDAGQVIEDSPAEVVVDKPAHPFTAQLIAGARAKAVIA